ncbi:hypothetical protein MLD38_035906 [Melastoma candidum]|uniref:Uncharacterized protein n=1 Tax=Melastoma candidum TaxID=119954 RepID=A0ACB9LHZ7_9MYRT|nr:hypothetical protein MLD38_035906 [Melastoma candidum]
MYDDEFEEAYGHGNGHQKGGPKQQQQHGHGGGKGLKGNGKKSEVVDEKGCGKKGGVFDIQGLVKALGKVGSDGSNKGKKGGKGGKNGGGKVNKGENSGGGDKNSGKNGGGKKGGNEKNKGGGGGGGGKGGGGGHNGGGGGGGKKGGKNNNDGMNQMMQPGFSDLERFNQMMMSRGGGGVNVGNNGGSGGGFMGQMGGYHQPQSMGQMGSYNHPMGNYPAVQGLPAGINMNAGYYPGAGGPAVGGANPYLVMLNQQQQMQHQPYGINNGEMFHHPAMYARAHPPPMSYVPPMHPSHPDPFVHMFSDENTGSCSIM